MRSNKYQNNKQYQNRLNKETKKRTQPSRLKTDFQIYQNKHQSNVRSNSISNHRSYSIKYKPQQINKNIDNHKQQNSIISHIESTGRKNQFNNSKDTFIYKGSIKSVKNNVLSFGRQQNEDLGQSRVQFLPKGLNDYSQRESVNNLSHKNSLQMKIKQKRISNQHKQTFDPQFDQKTDYLQELLRKIKKPVHYQQKQTQYIYKEKQFLVKMVKKLSKKLDQQLNSKALHQKKQSSIIYQANSRQKRLAKGPIESQRHNQPFRRILRSKTQFGDQSSYISDVKQNAKSISVLQFQQSLNQVDAQFNTNDKLINNMRNQLAFLNKKYQIYQHSFKNYVSIQKSIQQLKSVIKLKKQQMARIRTKKHLNEKNLIKVQKNNGNLFGNINDTLSTNATNHSTDIISSLKSQLTQLMRKKQNLLNKIQSTDVQLNRIQQLKAKNNVKRSHQKQLIEEMKQHNIYQKFVSQRQQKGQLNKSNKLLSSKTKQNRNNQYDRQDDLKILHNKKRLKLQILTKTIKRQQETFKRKYYNLLKQFEQVMDNSIIVPQNKMENSQQDQKMQSFVDSSPQKQLEMQIKRSQEQIYSLQQKVYKIAKNSRSTIYKQQNVYKQGETDELSLNNKSPQNQLQVNPTNHKKQSKKLKQNEFQLSPFSQQQYSQLYHQFQKLNAEQSQSNNHKKNNKRLEKFANKQGNPNKQSFPLQNKHPSQNKNILQRIINNPNKRGQVNAKSQTNTKNGQKYIGRFKKQKLFNKLDKRKQLSQQNSPKSSKQYDQYLNNQIMKNSMEPLQRDYQPEKNYYQDQRQLSRQYGRIIKNKKTITKDLQQSIQQEIENYTQSIENNSIVKEDNMQSTFKQYEDSYNESSHEQYTQQYESQFQNYQNNTNSNKKKQSKSYDYNQSQSNIDENRSSNWEGIQTSQVINEHQSEQEYDEYIQKFNEELQKEQKQQKIKQKFSSRLFTANVLLD